MFVSVQSAVALTWLGTDFYWVRIPIHSFELAILILTGFSFAWGAFLFRTWRKVKREIRRMSVLQA